MDLLLLMVVVVMVVVLLVAALLDHHLINESMNGILALFFSVQMCLNLKLQILQMSALVTLGLVHAVDSFLITDSIYHGWRTAPRGALGLSLAISSVLAWA